MREKKYFVAVSILLESGSQGKQFDEKNWMPKNLWYLHFKLGEKNPGKNNDDDNPSSN